jgi:hypothetical protein
MQDCLSSPCRKYTTSCSHTSAAELKPVIANSVAGRSAVCGSRDLVRLVQGPWRHGARETRTRQPFEFGNISAAIGFFPLASSATQIECMCAPVMRRRIVLQRGHAVDNPRQRDWLSAVSAKYSTVVLNLRFLTHSDLVWAGVMQRYEEGESYTGGSCASIPISSYPVEISYSSSTKEFAVRYKLPNWCCKLEQTKGFC